MPDWGNVESIQRYLQSLEMQKKREEEEEAKRAAFAKLAESWGNPEITSTSAYAPTRTSTVSPPLEVSPQTVADPSREPELASWYARQSRPAQSGQDYQAQQEYDRAQIKHQSGQDYIAQREYVPPEPTEWPVAPAEMLTQQPAQPNYLEQWYNQYIDPIVDQTTETLEPMVSALGDWYGRMQEQQPVNGNVAAASVGGPINAWWNEVQERMPVRPAEQDQQALDIGEWLNQQKERPFFDKANIYWRTISGQDVTPEEMAQLPEPWHIQGMRAREREEDIRNAPDYSRRTPLRAWNVPGVIKAIGETNTGQNLRIAGGALVDTWQALQDDWIPNQTTQTLSNLEDAPKLQNAWDRYWADKRVADIPFGVTLSAAGEWINQNPLPALAINPLNPVNQLAATAGAVNKLRPGYVESDAATMNIGDFIDQQWTRWENTRDTFKKLSQEQQDNYRVAFGGVMYSDYARNLEDYLNRESKIRELQGQIEAAEASGNTAFAATLYPELQKILDVSLVDIFDDNTNLAAMMMSNLLDPIDWLGAGVGMASKAITGAPNLIQGIKQMRNMNNILRISGDDALQNITKAAETFQPYIDVLTEGKKVNLYPGRKVAAGGSLPQRNLLNRLLNPLALTEFSKTDNDAMQAFNAIRAVLNNGEGGLVVDKTQIIQRLTTLSENPAELIRNFQVGFGTLGNKYTASVLPMLKGIDWAKLQSLGDIAKNPQVANTEELLADIYGTIWPQIGKFNGLSDIIPYQRTLIERVPVIGRGFKILRFPADLSRAILGFNYLAMPGANTIRNAVGGTSMLAATDTFALIPLKKIADNLAMRLGTAPTPRMQEALYDVRLGRQAMGAASETARKVGEKGLLGWAGIKTPEWLKSLSDALYSVPYGNYQIPLPGGQALSVSEQSMYAQGFNTAFNRSWYYGWAETLDFEFLQRLQNYGIPDDLVDDTLRWLKEHGPTMSKKELGVEFRRWVNSFDRPIDLSNLNVPLEVFDLDVRRAVNNILRDGMPGSEAIVRANLERVFSEEKAGKWGKFLAIAPSDPVPYEWTTVEVPALAAEIVDSAVDAVRRAGGDVGQVLPEIERAAKSYIDNTLGAMDRVRNELAGSANNPESWNIASEFWWDMFMRKGQAYETVNDLGRRASSLNTPAAWEAKWQGTLQTWQEYGKDLARLADEYRQRIMNPGVAGPSKRLDISEMIRRYVEWDNDWFNEVSKVELGKASPDAQNIWDTVIEANRNYIDNSLTRLYAAFQRFPSLDNFDILISAYTKNLEEGARAAGYLRPYRDQVLNGTMDVSKYYKLRNQVWRQYFGNGVLLNDGNLRAMVLNGLAEQTESMFKWVDEFNGKTYRLEGPADSSGKWLARADDGSIETFYAPTTKGKSTPFTLPQNVIDDFNRVVNNVSSLADEVIEELTQAASAVQQTLGGYRRPTLTNLTRQAAGEVQPGRVYSPPELRYHSGQARSEVRQLEPPTEYGKYDLGPEPRGIQRSAEAGPEYRPPELRPLSGDDLPPGSPVRPQTPQAPSSIPDVIPSATPNVDDLRRTARDAGIATASEAGRGFDNWLVNFINKNTGADITRLDELTPEQMQAAMDALRARAVENAAQQAPTAALPRGQQNMFAETSEDLPVFSGGTYGPRQADTFAPTEVQRQEGMFDTRPRMGEAEPSYAPRVEPEAAPVPKVTGEQDIVVDARVSGPRPGFVEGFSANGRVKVRGDDGRLYQFSPKNIVLEEKWPVRYSDVEGNIQSEIDGLRDTLKQMEDLWFAEIRTTGGGGSIRSVVARGHKKGRTTLGVGHENDVDPRWVEEALSPAERGYYGSGVFNTRKELEDFVVEYERIKEQIRVLESNLAEGGTTRFKRMSGPEIIEDMRPEMLEMGVSPETISNLAKEDRSTILDYIEVVLGLRGDELGDQGTYFSAGVVPGFENLLGRSPVEYVKELADLIRKSRSTNGVRSMGVGEIAGRNITMIDDVERLIIDNLPAILQGTRNTIPDAMRLRMIDAFDDFIGRYDDVSMMAAETGRQMADFNMIDFNNRRAVDTALSLLMGFHIFWSRMPTRMAQIAFTKPHFVDLLATTERIRQENLDRQGDMPQRYDSTIPLWGGWRGGNPLTYTIAGYQYINPNQFINPDEANNEAERWINRVQQWTPQLWTHWQYGLDAMLDKYKPLPGGEKRFDKHQLADMLPLYRAAGYGAAATTGNSQWIRPQAEWLPKGLGNYLGAGDEYDYGRISREMMLMVAEGEADPETYKLARDAAMQVREAMPELEELTEADMERAAELFEEGVRRAAVNRGIAILGARLLGMPIYPWSQTEGDVRSMQKERDALGAKKNPYGSQEAIRAFEEQEFGESGNMIGDVYDASRSYVNDYPQSGDAPVPPAYPYKQNFTPGRPGVDVITSRYWDEKKELEDSYETQIEEVTAQIEAASQAGQDAQALYDQRSALYDEKDEALLALEGRYPNRKPDTDYLAIYRSLQEETERSEQQPPYDPTRISMPPEAADMYGNFSPDERAEQAEKIAKNIAYAVAGDKNDIYAKYRDELQSLAEAKSWKAYYALKDKQQAELDAWQETFDSVQAEMLAKPNLLVYGRPTGQAPGEAVGKLEERISQEDAKKDAKAAKAGTKARTTWTDSEGKTAAQYWDEYNSFGDDYESKRAYLLANPEFAAYYKSKYGEEGEVMWWEKQTATADGIYSRWRVPWSGGWSGGGGGWSSSSDGNSGYDRGRPQQAYMLPIRGYERSNYPMEFAQYKSPGGGLTMAQIQSMLGARRNTKYTS